MKSLFDEAIDEIMNGNRLDEIKLSRVWEYVQDDSYIFGVVSAFRGTNDIERNEVLSEQLENDIKKLGHGFVKMSGGFVEVNDKDLPGREVREKSFLITAKSGNDNEKFKGQMLMLGKKYDQDSILYKDGRGFYELATSTRKGKIGDVLNSFEYHAGRDNITMAKKFISEYFSELIYGPHKDRKFLFPYKGLLKSKDKKTSDSEVSESKFVLKEFRPIEHNPRWLAVARGERSRWITITE